MRFQLDPFSPSGVSVAVEKTVIQQVRQANGYVTDNISGLLSAGSNVTITGNGTKQDPYSIASSGGTGGGGGIWGSITGTLSSQTDLNTALGLKAATTYVDTQDALNVRKAGAETITGVKTFNAGTLLDKGSQVFNVVAYGAVGNGSTDDATAIQSAITAIQAAGGGTLFFPLGTYIVGTDLLITGSNITVRGAGIGSVIKAKAATNVNCLKLSGASHIIVDNLAIDGNKANVTFISPGTQYSQEAGIWATGCTDIRVTNCYIHDTSAGGLLVDASNRTFINNNLVENCGDNGIFLRPSSGNTGCDEATISNNIVRNGSFSGIQAIKSTNITISGNVSHGNGPSAAQGDGIGVEGCSYVTVQGNVVYNNGIQGINLRQTTEGVVSPLGSSHVILTGNVSYGHSSSNGDAGGILILATDDVICSNNLVYNNYFGINIAAGSSIDATKIKVSDNKVTNSGDTGIRINLGTLTTIDISNNYVADNVGHGLYTNQRVNITGGIYKGSTGAGKCGIVLDTGANGSTVIGASIFDNADNGILVNGTCANVQIKTCLFDNVVGTSQGRALYEVSGAGPTKLIDNIIRNMSNQDYFFNNGSSVFDEVTLKQPTLVSGTNIKTVNGSSLLGSGNLTISGGSGITRTITTITSTVTGAAAASTDYVYLLGSGAVFTMPTAVANTNRYTLKNTTTGNLTINSTSSQTFDGGALVLGASQSVDLISNNTNWIII